MTRSGLLLYVLHSVADIRDDWVIVPLNQADIAAGGPRNLTYPPDSALCTAERPGQIPAAYPGVAWVDMMVEVSLGHLVLRGSDASVERWNILI